MVNLLILPATLVSRTARTVVLHGIFNGNVRPRLDEAKEQTLSRIAQRVPHDVMVGLCPGAPN